MFTIVKSVTTSITRPPAYNTASPHRLDIEEAAEGLVSQPYFHWLIMNWFTLITSSRYVFLWFMKKIKLVHRKIFTWFEGFNSGVQHKYSVIEIFDFKFVYIYPSTQRLILKILL